LLTQSRINGDAKINCLALQKSLCKFLAENFKYLLKFRIMIQNIQAIYENGILHPLQPLDLPENEIVEIDVRGKSSDKKEESTNSEKMKAFDEWMNSLDPNTPVLTDEQISRESIYEEQLLRQI
jgi:predicted DNA-binding antitoxin AbrB/MazE fold protein